VRRIGSLVGLTLLGGIVCGIAAWASIVLLEMIFWGPWSKELGARNIHAHDVGAAFLAPLALCFVGVMSIATTAASLLAIVFVRNIWFRRTFVYAVNALPAIVTALLINPHVIGRGSVPHPVWSYPLAEVAILAIGLGWAFFLQRRAARIMDQ